MTAPDKIRQLVETFEQNLDDYRTHKNETELRRQFLDPFFEALGWDVSNTKGSDERQKEVAHELSVEIDGQQKKADYAFRTGTRTNADKFDFLVEAKKPSVKIESNPVPAFQVRRYGWSAKLPVNILTDFEHFAVYDCRAKPSHKDKVSAGRILLVHYKDYVEKWDELAALFSPDAIRRGVLDRFSEGTKGKKGTADVDDDFLAEIERWRDLLARNIALRNKDKGLTEAQLNYAVQMTIDRIVFLRIAEERGMEEYGRLLGLTLVPSLFPSGRGEQKAEGRGESGEQNQLYGRLKRVFIQADERYNSGLFHFKSRNQTFRDSKSLKVSERVSIPDTITPHLEIDDRVLKDIIENLYEPKSPYAFAYIPADILGSVYERFLGKVIRLTAGGGAKVEDKPEVRKAGGVYYTPTYIVDYIVKNTVGRLVGGESGSGRLGDGESGIGKTPKEVSELRIVDPACGSGSFLLGAYQYLLNWHLDWYVNNDLEKALKRRVILTQDNKTYRLSMDEKKRILLNNIFGVDLDPQAVEVTKLSLLLKVVEDPGQLTMFSEGHILPDLGNNIKCGNSLIGMDYFDGQLMADPDEMARVNPFDWEAAFPQVFDPHPSSPKSADGKTEKLSRSADLGEVPEGRRGFDAVIGNPPYLFITELESAEKNHYFKKFSTTEYRFDVCGLFSEISIQKLLRVGGYLSFIIPHTLLSNDSFTKLRQLFLEKTHLVSVIDIGPGVFQNAKNETMIFIATKKITDGTELTNVLVTNSKTFPAPEKQFQIKQSIWSNNKNSSWLVNVDAKEGEILSKMEQAEYRLGDLCTINQGLRTGDNEKYLSKTKHDDLWKRVVGGKHVGRYEPLIEENFVLYDPKVLDAPRKREIFESQEKIVVQEIRNITLPRRIIATYDDEQYYCLQSTNVINLRPAASEIQTIKALLGFINSNVVNFFFRQKFSGNNHIASNQLAQIPIPLLERAQHDQMVSLVERMLALTPLLSPLKGGSQTRTPQEMESVQRQVEATDKAIDRLVYELYGLTEEEIRIVEGG